MGSVGDVDGFGVFTVALLQKGEFLYVNYI